VRVIDWASLDRHLLDIYATAKGEPAWPPLALSRVLVLAVWYDLSDVNLAEALEDRASFRCFCGFAAHEPTPERTAFVRIRRQHVWRGPDKILFDEVTRQLKVQVVTIKTGTLVDAAVIASATYRMRRPHCPGTSNASLCTGSKSMWRRMLMQPSSSH
jgi:IS5 family transposase